jgi:hypothetical protein
MQTCWRGSAHSETELDYRKVTGAEIQRQMGFGPQSFSLRDPYDYPPNRKLSIRWATCPIGSLRITSPDKEDRQQKGRLQPQRRPSNKT